MILFLSSFVCMFFLFALIKAFHKLWWVPTRIKNSLALQGIKGPNYRFLQGNAKELLAMKASSLSSPMSLSHNIFPKVQPNIQTWKEIYGKNFLQWLGTQPQLVITESDLIKEILNNKNQVYSKPKLQGYLKKIFGDGIVTTEGDKWVKLRKLANHSLNVNNLKGMIPAMIASTEMMLERWERFSSKEIEVFQEFRLLTSEVISRTAFGSSYLEGKKIFDMLSRLTLLATQNFYKIRLPIISKFFKTIDDIESEKLEKEINDCIMEIVKKREEKVMNGEENSYGSDLLGGLLKAHYDVNEELRISVDDLITECKTFYFAGQETTNSLLAWTVFLLSMHIDWQEEARKEVLKVFGQQNPNPDDIAKLKTMSLIINESMRLYPPVLGFSRKLENKGKVGNLVLPANMEIFISTLALHHDPQIWGRDVHKFKPERFSEGVSKTTNNNSAAFFPFGMGPRICLGMNFAIIEAKIVLSMILQRYAFTLSPAYVHSPFQLLSLQPQQGIQVMLQPLYNL